MLKILCGVMNESVIHRYTKSDPGGSYTGVWLNIPETPRPIVRGVGPSKTIEIHPFFVRE